MGCIDSKPAPKSEANSESIEIPGAGKKSPSSPPTKALSPKQRLAAKQSADEIINPTHQEPIVSTNESTVGDAPPPPPPPAIDKPPASVTPPRPPPEARKSSTDKKVKMSDLLQAERVKKTISSSASGTFSGEGREGWLYRENEEAQTTEDDTVEEFIKMWVVVADNKLQYFSSKPKAHYSEPFLARGYMALDSATSECKVFERRHDGGFLAGSVGKNCFRVKEGGTTIVFSASSQSERDEWVFLIQEAIRGVKHTVESSGAKTGGRSHKNKRTSTKFAFSSVEFPRKEGVLKKKSIEGKKFGFKNIKTRWFKLEGGEIRYYADESMRPSSLKGTLSLRGCSLPATDEANGDVNITVQRPDGHCLLMIAASPELAGDWRSAIASSISLLLKQEGALLKNRRANIGNVQSDSRTAATSKEVVPKTAETIRAIETCMDQHFMLKLVRDVGSVIDVMQPIVAIPGDVIIWQGDIGDLFYVLESGHVDIIKDSRNVARLGPGRAFGEVALINDVQRTATVRASTLCKAWVLDRGTLRHLMHSQEVAARESKVAFLQTVTMFEKLTESTLGQIADVMKYARFSPEERVIRQGEVGDMFYIILEGRAVVTQSSSMMGTPKELVTLSTGQYFGELALISNEPRKATVAAASDTELHCFTIDKVTFTSVLGTLKDAETESVGLSILRKVKILEGLSDKQLVTVSRHLRTMEYEDGQSIISQGEEGDSFYMIAEGEVAVAVNHSEVARLKVGSYFGEMALMNDDKRNATVTASGHVTCLALHRSEFVNLLGPLDELLKEEAARREAEAREKNIFGRLTRSLSQTMKLGGVGGGSSSHVKKVSGEGTGVEFHMDELLTVRILGTGRFGKVKLVQHAVSNMAYALKILNKQIVEDLHAQKAAFAECDFLRSIDHPFVPALYGTFQDEACLYMLLEMLPGGDFWTILYDHRHWTHLEKTSLGGIELSAAKFYFSNILSAVAYLHKKDIIYRDLKPENMVMERTGYLKIVDFGSAKKVVHPSTTNTICGTPEYMSPEMVAARGHGKAVDYWALGVFLFEILVGSSPFEQSDVSAIYQRIMASGEALEEAFSQLSHFDSLAKDLIMKLLVDMPGVRYGMLRNGEDDIWNHPFLSGFTLQHMEEKLLDPPIRPDVEHLFDPTALDEEQTEEEESDALLLLLPYEGRFDFSDF